MNVTVFLLVIALAAIMLSADAGTRADAVDAYVRAQMKRRHIPGLSLAVVRGGRVVRARGYGFANIEHRARATERTVYQVQSVTKQFTAAAVMMLVEEGKLRVEDPVAAHLPGTPATWSGITLRHLLTHTSGIKDFINEPTASLRVDVSEQDVFDATAPRPLNFAPGTRYAYSNTNYHLLAMVIRKVTGRAWGDYVMDRICRPTGMADTRVVDLGAVLPGRAAGYSRRDGATVHGDFVAESILSYAGGGLMSTVVDLAKWDMALRAGKLLKQTTLDEMWSPVRLSDGTPAGYGYGWGVGEVAGHRFVSHTGGHITGFTTIVSRYRDDDLTVIVLTNLVGADVTALARGVAGHYVPALAPRKPRALPDRDPALTARLRALIEAAAADRVDLSVFTDEMRSVMTPERLKQGAGMLGSLGPLRRTSVLERSEKDGARTFRYLLEFEEADVAATMVVAPDGRIAGLEFGGV